MTRQPMSAVQSRNSSEHMETSIRELRQTIRNIVLLNVALWGVTMTLIMVTLVVILTK